MKNISTQVFAVTLALVLGAPVAAQPLELAKDAPDKHVVVQGDTLWGIAGRFLQKPWRWPEIWQLNREQIHNPHLIYPGDVVYLDNSSGSPRLRLGKPLEPQAAAADDAAASEPTQRLEPRVRSEALSRDAIPTVSAAAIEPFLNRPLVVDANGMLNDPRIVATQDGRVHLGRGELAYVGGMLDPSVKDWFVYRPAAPLLDPDTRQPIAWQAVYVGSARLEREGDPAAFRILSTTSEVGPGDRLAPADRKRVLSYAPHPPEAPVNGRIVGVLTGVTQAGRNSVVALNVGAADGVDVGTVLRIKQHPRLVPDRDLGKFISLPGEPTGHLLVFRVFDKIAYGLIMRSSQPIEVGDDVTNP